MQDWKRRNPEKVRDHRDRRRARERGAFVAPVDRLAIYSRDHWHCQICKLPCSRAQASLDHVIPLARGGTHEPSNVQLAHLKCNMRKGSR